MHRKRGKRFWEDDNNSHIFARVFVAAATVYRAVVFQRLWNTHTGIQTDGRYFFLNLFKHSEVDNVHSQTAFFFVSQNEDSRLRKAPRVIVPNRFHTCQEVFVCDNSQSVKLISIDFLAYSNWVTSQLQCSILGRHTNRSIKYTLEYSTKSNCPARLSLSFSWSSPLHSFLTVKHRIATKKVDLSREL